MSGNDLGGYEMRVKKVLSLTAMSLFIAHAALAGRQAYRGEQVISDSGISRAAPPTEVAQIPKMLPPDITPEETAARAAIARNTWISKVPHVTQVLPSINDKDEMTIIVVVDKNENVGAVERKIPSKLEGFPVEVGGPTTGESL